MPPSANFKTGLGLLATGLALNESRKDRDQYDQQIGYKGEIPDYEFVREQVQDTYLPDRVPGSRGQRYFSDYEYVTPENAPGARQGAFDQALDLRTDNLSRVPDQEYFAPALTAPTGINSIVPGSSFSYDSRLASSVDRKGSTPTNYISTTGTEYNSDSVTDPNEFQFYNDGTVYAPGYGFLNFGEDTEVLNYANFGGFGEFSPPADESTADESTADESTADESTADPEGTPADPEGTPDDDPAGDAPPSGGPTPDADGTYTFNHPTQGPITGLTLDGYRQMETELAEEPYVPPTDENEEPPAEFGRRPFDSTELQQNAYNIIKADNGDTNNDNYISADEWATWTFNKGPSTGYSENWAERMEASKGYEGLDQATINLLNSPDANGVYISADNFYADEKSGFDFTLNGKTRFVPVVFREGGTKFISAESRAEVEEAAQSVIDGNPKVSNAIYNQVYARTYFDYLLKLENTRFTPNGAKAGGIMSLAGGGYLGGPTDGMADQINTSIDGQQPAALSDGEFVLPADVVSHLGNGNSDAGADVLYGMMNNIRTARTGSSKQGEQINPMEFMPSQRGIA